MSIPKNGWSVRIETVSAEQTMGRVLSGTLGWGPAAFINWATAEIPKYVEGIDNEATPFLEQLSQALEKLAEGWKNQTEPSPELLKQVLGLLEQFLTYTDKAHLLYPQIMEAKPSSTSTTVQGEETREIKGKQSEARRNAEEIEISLVKPLMVSLKPFLAPTMSSNRNADESLQKIGQLCAALKEIAHEQRSIVSKIMHTITTIVKKTFKEQWEGGHGQKGKGLTLSSHPLMQLLSVIGYYSLERTYLENDKQRRIDQALRSLDTQCAIFRGIYADLRDQTRNLKSFHKAVTRHVKEVIGRLRQEDKQEVYEQVANFALQRKKELIEEQIRRRSQEKEQKLKKANQELAQEYRRIGTDGVGGNLLNKMGKTSTDDQKDQVLRERKREFESAEEQINRKSSKKISDINQNPFWRNLENDKVTWGRNCCENSLNNVPEGYFDEFTIDEILWKAVAYQQQKAEWLGLKKKLQQEQDKKPEMIVDSLGLAIEYLERFASIQEGLKEEETAEALGLVHQFVLNWMDYSKVQMERYGPNTWEKAKINDKFDEALQGIRKGEIAESIQTIQNFIRESNYWKAIWSNVPSPLESLAEPFKGFCSNMPPPKPPKSAEEVKKLLGKDGGEVWNPAWLPEANTIEKEQVLEHALAYGCFEFVARVLGLNGDKISIYKRLVTALDEIKQVEQVNDENLKGIIAKFLGKDFDGVKDQKGLDSLKNCYEIWGGDKRQYHKHLYLELINIFLREKGNYSIRSWGVWSIYSTIYDLMELFIRPFTEQLFDRIDALFKTGAGNLGEKHLVPIVGITKAFSTYMLAMKSWEGELTRQAQGQIKSGPGRTLSGTKDDLRVLLDRPDRYEGMTPSQITAKIGYAILDQICLPDFSRKVAQGIDSIKKVAFARRAQNKYVNIPIVGVQLLLSSPLYLGLNVMYYVVKMTTASINVGLHQVGKLYLWKTNILGKMLDDALESVFIDTDSAPVLDTLLLEQLEQLLAELDKPAPPESSQAAAGDERNKQVISEALQHLFEVIRLDKYESLDAFQTRSSVLQAKKIVYNQLKKLITTVLLSTSKSLMQKDQIDALLFELFRIANEALQGGKSVVLTLEQKIDLTTRLGRRPSEEEIQQEGARIARENVEKIPKVLAKIREKAINPAVDKAIDDTVQTSSQLLLDYITWFQNRLFVSSEEGQQTNILQFLSKKLVQEPNPEVLREIHTFYALFVQEMTEFQTKLDASPSPNSPDFNRFILEKLNKPLAELTLALTAYIKNPQEGTEACQQALRGLEEVQVLGHTILVRIEEAEKSRVMGMQKGLEGIVRKAIGESFDPLKNHGKSLAHASVQWETDNKVDELRAMYKNKILVKHMLLWQMRLYLNPELARA